MLAEIVRSVWQLPNIKHHQNLELTLDEENNVRIRLIDTSNDQQPKEQRIVLSGELNKRIKQVLTKYGPEIPIYQLPSDLFNCHGAALYVTGYQERMKGIRAGGIEAFYFGQGFEAELMTVQPELHPDNPTIIHLLREPVREPIKREHIFTSENCIHSVVAIGRLGDEVIVFEKNGPLFAKFSTLREAREGYSPINGLLYVTRRFL